MSASPSAHSWQSTAKWLQDDHMRRLGIANTMRLASLWNRWRHGKKDAWRRELYRQEFSALLAENGLAESGSTAARPLVMRDGWALDTSHSLPHLDRMLEDANRIIAERGGERLSERDAYRSYFQDVWTPEDCEKYPSFLDFATSSQLLSTVGHYIQNIPILSPALPSGVRLVESNAAFDDRPNEPHDSQLYHIDYYSRPNVYVLVLLRDTTSEHGPWTFLPRSVSQRVRKQLGYWKRSTPYRLSDAEIYSVVDPSEAIEFAYPRGTVLFIESSGCFHFGSRNAVKPRFQTMLGYHGVCRTDFTEHLLPSKVYPIEPGASRLRQLVLNKDLQSFESSTRVEASVGSLNQRMTMHGPHRQKVGDRV